jgi:hypothetical protein
VRPVEIFLRDHPDVLARVRAYQVGQDVLTGLMPGEKPRPVDDRRAVTIRLPEIVYDHLRRIAFTTRESQNTLLTKALDALFVKHGYPVA